MPSVKMPRLTFKLNSTSYYGCSLVLGTALAIKMVAYVGRASVANTPTPPGAAI